MNTQPIAKLMVPIAEYATASEEATLHEAVVALEEAQANFDTRGYPHRAVLVLDAQGRVVGKISQTDVLRALEPKYETLLASESLAYTGMPRSFMQAPMEKYSLWGGAMHDVCKKSGCAAYQGFHAPPRGRGAHRCRCHAGPGHSSVGSGGVSIAAGAAGGRRCRSAAPADEYAVVSEAIKSCAV